MVGYRAFKLFEHSTKIMEIVLKHRVTKIVEVNEVQFGFMPEKWTTDVIFIVMLIKERNCIMILSI